MPTLQVLRLPLRPLEDWSSTGSAGASGVGRDLVQMWMRANVFLTLPSDGRTAIVLYEYEYIPSAI